MLLLEQAYLEHFLFIAAVLFFSFEVIDLKTGHRSVLRWIVLVVKLLY